MVSNPAISTSPEYIKRYKMLAGLCPLMPFPWHSGKPVKRKGANQYLFPSGTCKPLWIELICVGGADAPIEHDFNTSNSKRKFAQHMSKGQALIRSFSLSSTKRVDVDIGPQRPRIKKNPTPPAEPSSSTPVTKKKKSRAKQRRLSRKKLRDEGLEPPKSRRLLDWEKVQAAQSPMTKREPVVKPKLVSREELERRR